jgi:cold shock CspA family protein
MQTPIQIDFQGMNPDEMMRQRALRHIAALEKRYGRATSCRVVVRAPGGHHRTGGLYEVRIHVALPNGKEVNIDRTPHADERHADKMFALNDAFKRARRQLQDQVKTLRGKVKSHNGPPLGKVTKLDREGGFGFLEDAEGREFYFHRNSVLNDAFGRLRIGMRVAFAEGMGVKGPQASTVRILGKHGMM